MGNINTTMQKKGNRKLRPQPVSKDVDNISPFSCPNSRKMQLSDAEIPKYGETPPDVLLTTVDAPDLANQINEIPSQFIDENTVVVSRIEATEELEKGKTIVYSMEDLKKLSSHLFIKPLEDSHKENNRRREFTNNSEQSQSLEGHRGIEESVEIGKLNTKSIAGCNQELFKVKEAETVKQSLAASSYYGEQTLQCRGSSVGAPIQFTINQTMLNNSMAKNLVIFDNSNSHGNHSAISIIHESAKKCQKNLEFKIMENTKLTMRTSLKTFDCTVILNGEEVGRAEGLTRKYAKVKACVNALRMLQRTVYTIKVTSMNENCIIIDRRNLVNSQEMASILTRSNGDLENRHDIGNPGQNLHGSNHVTQDYGFEKKILDYLASYRKSGEVRTIQFTSDFSEQERKVIIRLAKVFNLSPMIRGQANKSQVYIKPRLSPVNLLQLLISSGGTISNYILEDGSLLNKQF